jgi:hypothetical protein
MAGTLTISTLSDGTNSTSATNPIKGSAKAWVNFNPSSGSSATIQASFNVSSVTYNTTGEYTINFTTAFSDTYYAVSGAAKYNGVSTAGTLRAVSISSYQSTQAASQTTTSVSVCVAFANGSSQDPTTCTVVVHR